MKLGELKKSDAGAAELRELLARFNDTRRDYPRELTVHARFSQQAATRPDAIAVVHGERVYTYREVDETSNRFARFLIDHGFEREDLVAVGLERAYELVVTILGVLKAGGAYLPIDCDAPFDRVRQLLDDAGTRLLVSEKRHIRMLNKLQWECPRLEMLFCADSNDVHREPEEISKFMQADMWDLVGLTSFDDISCGGWKSSYTGEWLSREVMDDYADNIRVKLLPYLNPATRVLEIGCSSGISLLRIAPLVGSYYGTDLSQTILSWTEREIARAGVSNVRLRSFPAHETHCVEERGFDVVIMNSVIECFSGYNYLRDVLRQAIERMAERGVIFLGNLWDLDLKDRFVKSLIEFRAANAGKGYRTKVDRSEDLYVCRDFLRDLQHEFPEIGAIEFSETLGTAQSELSEHGFDAILHIDRSARSDTSLPPRRKWQFDLTALESYPDSPLEERTSADGLAYIIYTSGTSGRPKGVMVEHRAVLRLVLNTDYLQLGPVDLVLQTGSLAFDASSFEIWGPLLNGGGLCRPSDLAILDPVEVARLIKQHRVTTMFITTGLFNQYVDSGIDIFAELNNLLTGGERASVYHFNKVRQKYPDLALYHVYGPTENTTFTTWHRIDRTYSSEVPIGRPIANTEVLILDESGLPVPVGVPGEICAAGDGVARGYMNDPELTRRKFTPHPWEPDRRIYRTGDVGLWRADGTIEFLGRLDNQVKIRGYRIELAEIEFHILRDPQVKEAVVVAREVPGTGRELIAYATTKDGEAHWDGDELRGRLRQVLPDYMVPAFVVRLDRMPLNSNGKVDRDGLPDPAGAHNRESTRDFQPESETEEQLAAVWKGVLGRQDIGMTEDFFDLGGHSLTAMKLSSLTQSKLGVAVPATTVFMHPTIRRMAQFLLDTARFGAAVADLPMVLMNRGGSGKLLFAFPPGTGDALSYAQLALVLDSVDLYCFNFLEAESRIEDYVDLILDRDPVGPYQMVGYSGGGNLAYYVARALEKRRKRVSRIVMFDSARNIARVDYGVEEPRQLAAQFMDDDAFRPYLTSVVLREKLIRRVQSYYAFFSGLLDEYPVEAKIQLITSWDSADEFRDESGRLLISQRLWSEVARGGFARFEGYGGHNTMLYHPHVEPNARLLMEILAGPP